MAAFSSPALALRTLQVDLLAMRADKTVVQVGDVFHLAIHVRVREQVAALDELVIPDVGSMQLLGDERHVTSSAAGTEVVETLTLEARVPGTYTFTGAYLDAIDGRTRKPSRFSANPVRVVVGGGSPFRVWRVWDAARILGLIVLAGTGILVLIAVAVTLVRTRPRPPPIVAPVAPLPPRTPRDLVADALRTYRTAPSHDALMHLRATLFAAAGAGAGSTLRDALSGAAEPGLREVLIAAEHTAFGPAHARDASSAELIDATEAWLR